MTINSNKKEDHINELEFKRNFYGENLTWSSAFDFLTTKTEKIVETSRFLTVLNEWVLIPEEELKNHTLSYSISWIPPNVEKILYNNVNHCREILLNNNYVVWRLIWCVRSHIVEIFSLNTLNANFSWNHYWQTILKGVGNNLLRSYLEEIVRTNDAIDVAYLVSLPSAIQFYNKFLERNEDIVKDYEWMSGNELLICLK